MTDNTTPRPWSTSREDMDSFTVNADDTTGETEHVVYISRGDQPRIGVFAGKLDNARADANLIVEAVNSYSARVARAMESLAAAAPTGDAIAEAVRFIDISLARNAVLPESWRSYMNEVKAILTGRSAKAEGTGR
jgi:hypothetical protein